MKRFASERVANMMARLGLEEDVPIESRIVSKTIESAQGRVEGFNFDLRKRVVEFDDVINKQRETIYAERDKVLNNEDLTGTVPHALSWILIEACNNVLRHGDLSHPCTIFITSSASTVDLAVINGVAGSHLSLRPGRLGIIGMQERANAAGGNLTVTPNEDKWIVKAEFPLRSYSMVSDRA
jgi:signal transduction histidine kinase